MHLVRLVIGLLLGVGLASCDGSGTSAGDDDSSGDDDTTSVDDDTTSGDDDSSHVDDDTADDDSSATDDDTSDDDTADDDDTYVQANCGFELGDLTGFGHPFATWWVSPEGGLVTVVEQGDDFSGLVGEDDIEFSGDHAALLRSNEAADSQTWGQLITDPFVPAVPIFSFDQLSEVDDRGIELEISILDEYDNVLQSQMLTVETGGFVPGLPPGADPLDDFPEIVVGGTQTGTFVHHEFDLTPYWQASQTIQVRFRQHTLVDGVGFFTLLDNVCNAE